MITLMILLVAGPLWAQRDWLDYFTDVAKIDAKRDSLAWVVVRVDSLNLGRGDNDGCQTLSYGCEDHPTLMCSESWHDWVYDDPHFLQDNQHPYGLLAPGERWTETQRERICRVCMRHEWQAQKRVPRPKPKSEFKQLREQLSTMQLYEIRPVHPDSSSIIFKRLWPKP